MKVVSSEKWLNKSFGKIPSRFGTVLSEEHKQKISAAMKRETKGSSF
jgi:hypothetical protein